MPGSLVTQPRPSGAEQPAPAARSRGRARRARVPALIAGALALAGASALPAPASAIVTIGGTPAACTSPSSFSGVGMTRALELLSINAFEDPCISPPDVIALWRPAGSLTATTWRGSCVSIDVGRTQSTLHASGRSASGEYFVVRAVDGSIGNPDTFGVRRSATRPAGFQDPEQKCGARDVATSPVVSGNFVAVGNPEI